MGLGGSIVGSTSSVSAAPVQSAGASADATSVAAPSAVSTSQGQDADVGQHDSNDHGDHGAHTGLFGINAPSAFDTLEQAASDIIGHH